MSENTFIFDAKTPLGDFYEITHSEENDFADHTSEVETIAGLLLNMKGDFLQEKEEITCGRCTFTVLKVKKYRIAKVRVYVPPVAEPETEG